MSGSSIRILIVEDQPADAELAMREIQKSLPDSIFQRVETESAFLDALEKFNPDLILSDYHLPRFNGMEALKLTLQHAPITPVIIFTGSLNEDIAVECMKAGADNYIIKENIKRLGTTIVHSLEEKKLRLERKQIEQDLHENEEKIRTLVEQSNDGVMLVDEQGKIIEWNTAQSQITGIPRTTAMGADIWDIQYQVIIPAHREKLSLEELKKIYFESYLSNRYGQLNGTLEIESVSATGEHKYLQQNSFVIKTEKGYRIGAIVRDVTERKQAENELRVNEERYRSLFENMLNGFAYCQILVDEEPPQDFIYLGVNQAFEKLTGLKGVVGKKVSEVIPGIRESNPELLAAYARVALTGIPEVFETYIEHLQMWFSISVYCPQKEFFVAIFDVITERKLAERLIHQYASELEMRVEERTAELIHANRTKDEFLANMSHELRTPLNGILGFSETLLEGIRGQLNERQQQAVEIIQSSGEHLLGLINDILDVSKIESGKFELQLQDVSVNDLCRSSLNFIRQLADKKFITVEYPPCPTTATILVDPKRIKQVLVNLLNNAVKFTPEYGKVKLEVQEDAKAGQVRFSITDTGIGIAPEDLQKLFKPFVQVDSSLSRQYEGTGLGLTLVKKLVELHNGSVDVKSDFGRGSCFSFTLPVNQKTWSSNHLFGGRNNERNPGAETASAVREKILLVEDNEPSIMVIQDYLESSGYQVFVAEDGKDLLSKAAEASPNIILMDIQMPYVNGLEAAKMLRADPRFSTVPIIALTAFAMTEDRENCLAAGMNEYLSKPVKLRELAQVIKRFISHPSG